MQRTPLTAAYAHVGTPIGDDDDEGKAGASHVEALHGRPREQPAAVHRTPGANTGVRQPLAAGPESSIRAQGINPQRPRSPGRTRPAS